MNGQSAPIPELCLHYIREIRKAQKESKPVDPRLWFKTLKRRGLIFDRVLEQSKSHDYDDLAGIFEKVKKEYEIYG